MLESLACEEYFNTRLKAIGCYMKKIWTFKKVLLCLLCFSVYKRCYFPILLPIALRQTPFETLESTE